MTRYSRASICALIAALAMLSLAPVLPIRGDPIEVMASEEYVDNSVSIAFTNACTNAYIMVTNSVSIATTNLEHQIADAYTNAVSNACSNAYIMVTNSVSIATTNLEYQIANAYTNAVSNACSNAYIVVTNYISNITPGDIGAAQEAIIYTNSWVVVTNFTPVTGTTNDVWIQNWDDLELRIYYTPLDSQGYYGWADQTGTSELCFYPDTGTWEATIDGNTLTNQIPGSPSETYLLFYDEDGYDYEYIRRGPYEVVTNPVVYSADVLYDAAPLLAGSGQVSAAVDAIASEKGYVKTNDISAVAVSATNYTYSVKTNIEDQISKITPTNSIAMFILPVNDPPTDDMCYGFELKCSTNNFETVQFWSKSAYVDDERSDGMRMFITGMMSDARKLREVSSYTPEGGEYLAFQRFVVVLVSPEECRHPYRGKWLYEGNSNMSWVWIKTSWDTKEKVNPYGMGEHELWRPVAPVKWLSKMPDWVSQ